MTEEEKEFEEEDDEVYEGAEYSPKSEFSKPKIVFEAMQRCIEVRSKEMMKGFWNVKVTKEGMPIRTWNPDYRKVFIGSVIVLRNLLSPEVLYNKKYKDDIKKIEDAIIKAKESCVYCEQTLIRNNGTLLWKKTGRKFIPDIGSNVVVNGMGGAKQIIGGWDDKVNIYWDVVLEKYDSMFACLNELIDHKNYFKQSTSY